MHIFLPKCGLDNSLILNDCLALIKPYSSQGSLIDIDRESLRLDESGRLIQPLDFEGELKSLGGYDMHQHIVEICQTLAKAGAVPGADFSIDPVDGGLRLNEAGYHLLTQLYPDIAWAEATQVVQPNPQAAIQKLHDRLGVNFCDRILDRIQQRLSTLEPAQAAYYLIQILTGVEDRTGISLYCLLIQRVDVSRFIYIETLLTSEDEVQPCNPWIGDLVWAAGGDRQDVDYDGDDAVLTENGLHLFEQVWAGENDVYEM